jgi:hypothetical protein
VSQETADDNLEATIKGAPHTLPTEILPRQPAASRSHPVEHRELSDHGHASRCKRERRKRFAEVWAQIARISITDTKSEAMVEAKKGHETAHRSPQRAKHKAGPTGSRGH